MTIDRRREKLEREIASCEAWIEHTKDRLNAGGSPRSMHHNRQTLRWHQRRLFELQNQLNQIGEKP